MKPLAVSISLLVFLLALVFPSFMESSEVAVFFVFLIATVGLIHGCNDLYLHKISPFLNKLSPFNRLSIYLGLGVFISLFYYFFTTECVLLFIFFSAYHFGEEQLSGRFSQSFVLKPLVNFFFGILLFLLLFLFDIGETNTFLNHMYLPQIAVFSTKTALLIVAISCLVLFISLVSIGLLSWTNFAIVLGEVLLIGLLFYSTSLLVGFSVYFIFWHSFPSISKQFFLLKKMRNYRTILLQILSVYGISIMGIGVIIYLFKDQNTLTNVLLGAAIAVSIPHILSISAAYRNSGLD